MKVTWAVYLTKMTENNMSSNAVTMWLVGRRRSKLQWTDKLNKDNWQFGLRNWRMMLWNVMLEEISGRVWNITIIITITKKNITINNKKQTFFIVKHLFSTWYHSYTNTVPIYNNWSVTEQLDVLLFTKPNTWHNFH